MSFTHWGSKTVSAAELRKASIKLATSLRFYQFNFCDTKREKEGEDLLPVLLVCLGQRGGTMAVAMVTLMRMMAMVTFMGSTMLR